MPFGEDVDYEFVVTNTGNEPLEDVTVDDTLLGDITDEFNLPDPLPVGDTAHGHGPLHAWPTTRTRSRTR